MRLIDADALLKHKSDHETISTHLIWNAPTVDAVPVIRCKDCRWFLPNESKRRGWCKYSQRGYPSADDYCSDAERKEE